MEYLLELNKNHSSRSESLMSTDRTQLAIFLVVMCIIVMGVLLVFQHV